MRKTVLPGGRIGMLGGGQLGKLFIEAAKKLGYKVHVFCPDADEPACAVASKVTNAAYTDKEALTAFARSVEVVTLEFENIPLSALEIVEAIVPVHPGKEVLRITQNRLEEKNFLSRLGFPVTSYAAVDSAEDLHAAINKFGLPAVLKTRTLGYDGKGQLWLHTPDAVAQAVQELDGKQWILEKVVPFKAECSVVAARGGDGSFAHFDVFHNTHKNGILDVTVCPNAELAGVSQQAILIARGIMTELKMTGMLCVEFFVTAEDGLLVNELAPRTHNSGHLTIDACKSSQFDLHVKSVCGLPLGDTKQPLPAAMANLLGDLWVNGKEPNWTKLEQFPGIKLHLYGKKEARPGRKMGHLTFVDKDPVNCQYSVQAARKVILT